MKNKINLLPLLFSMIIVVTSCSEGPPTGQAPPPPEVAVYVTKAETVPIFQTFVGQIYGAKDIAIRARVEGFLEGIHFKEGSRVAEGDLLYTIESQPFEANVAAQMSKVAEAKTMLAKAASDLKRYRPLAKRKAVSQSDLDSAVAQHEAAKASVEAAEANLRAAEIQLGYTKIYSPIDGVIGKTNAKVGDFVGRDPNPVILNTVSNIDTVLAEFFITETQYLTFARQYIAEYGSTLAAEEKDNSEFELILADGSIYPHKGKAEFIDREVDPATGAILIQTSFPNPENLLRPGQFARVKTMVREVKDGILVPQRSIAELQGVYRVFVVDDQNTVREREVTVGPPVDNFRLISSGLEPGEKVIYEGLQKVRDGVTARPVETEVERIQQGER